MSDNGDVESIDNIPTEVVDGALIHFLEGFVSLIFYREKAYPPPEGHPIGATLKLKRKRQMLFEVRLAVEPLGRLVDEMKQGLEVYSQQALLTDYRNFWLSETTDTPSEEEMTKLAPEELLIKSDNIEMDSLFKMIGKLSTKGRRQLSKVFSQFLHEHIEDIRKLAIEDAKKQGVNKGVFESQR